MMRGNRYFDLAVGAFVLGACVLGLGAGCHRKAESPPAARAHEEAPQGQPAQAVLIAPQPSDDEPIGRALSTGQSERPQSKVSLTEERDKGLYHIAIQDPYADMYDTGEGMAVRVRGGAVRRDPGSPDIGGIAWVLPGRVGWNLMPTVTDAAFATATQGVDIAGIAMKKMVEQDGVTNAVVVRYRAPEIYGEDTLFPSHVVRVQETWIGTNKLVRLVVNPVQYNPVTKELRLCYRLKAKLEFVKSLVPEGI